MLGNKSYFLNPLKMYSVFIFDYRKNLCVALHILLVSFFNQSIVFFFSYVPVRKSKQTIRLVVVLCSFDHRRLIGNAYQVARSLFEFLSSSRI